MQPAVKPMVEPWAAGEIQLRLHQTQKGVRLLMESGLASENCLWENPLFLWVIFHSYVELPEAKS